MTKLRPFVASSLLSLALGLSACPSDDGGATTTATDTTSDDATQTTSATETETETGGEPESSLVEIPGATFTMGCGADDSDCDANNPAHDVTVSSFAIERTEVSIAAYQACIDAGGCTAPAMDADCNYGVQGRENHPVNCVSWQQAADYCAWMDRRLPTEAEWELAAAGPQSRPFPWGSAEASCAHAHMFQMSGDMGGYGCLTGITSVVDAYNVGASIDGVLQLAGNVDEWVSDWYAADYYDSGETMDPQGPADGTQKVNRGGDMFDASPLNLRVFERRNSNPGDAPPERGFRCAADAA